MKPLLAIAKVIAQLVAILMVIFGMSSSTATAAAIVDYHVASALSKSTSVDVVVYFREKVDLGLARSKYDLYRDLVATATQSQRRIVDLLRKDRAKFRTFYIENAIAVTKADQSLIEHLAQMPEVASIRIDASSEFRLPQQSQGKVEAEGDISAHLKLIGADQVWSEFGVTGRGIVVAGQDTGILWNHQALIRQYRGYSSAGVDHNYNWHDAIRSSETKSKCSNNSQEPCDDRGHGTHTMGTIVGSDGSGNRIGVAPDSSWIGCRNMENGVGTVSSYLECFEFFFAPYPLGGNSRSDGRPDLAPHIVNNSWSCTGDEGCSGEEFLDAVKAMKVAGIMVVVAAGNEGPGCGSVAEPPAIYSGEILSVGAYNHYTKDIAYFSSFGPSAWNGKLAPNIVGPGIAVRSAVSTGTSSYDRKDGTSMAAPHVAGVVALLWSAKPELIGKIDETIDILQATAVPMKGKTSCPGFPGANNPNAVFGYGMVNAYNAVKRILGK